MEGVRTSAFAALCACAAIAAAATPRDEALAELKRVAMSSNFCYAVRISEKSSRDEVEEKGGVRTKVWYSELAAVAGTWRPPEWYEANRTNISAMVKDRWMRDHALCVFTWHMENPYVPHRWRNPSNYAPDAFRYKPGVKDFPEEHRHLLAEIIDGAGGECGTGTINGNTYYPPCRNPREWFGKVLRRQAEFLNGLVDDKGRQIPVVIRYLHESDGGWFPWGEPYATAEEFKKVCRVVCTYLRKNAGGDRLLFAYTPDRYWKPFGTEGDTNNTFLARYPGDAYTDIVGIDDYSIGKGASDANAAYKFKNSLRRLREISAFAKERGKVACISETGCMKGRDDFHSTLLRLCTSPGVNVAFAATWGGPYSIPKTEAGFADWRKFLDDPRVLTIKAAKGNVE